MFDLSFSHNYSFANLIEEERDFEYNLLTPIKIPETRFGRRLIKREQQKLAFILLKVENNFVKYLFDSEVNKYSTYKNIYDFFLDEYIFRIEYINTVFKPNYFEVNAHYFHQKFKQTEK